MVVKSISDNQHEILRWICDLNGISTFDVDLTYGNGSFYRGIPHPPNMFDIDPQVSGVRQADSRHLPLCDGSVKSVVFDPPFLTYVRAARKGNGNMVMANRFGGYWRYDELENHYRGTLVEAHRVLVKGGIMVFKCQDIIHNHKMHSTHVNVIGWADGLFRLKDMFILYKHHRMSIPPQKGTKPKVQRHARIHHSYFLVLERL